jgi:hypothetical protein
LSKAFWTSTTIKAVRFMDSEVTYTSRFDSDILSFTSD